MTEYLNTVKEGCAGRHWPLRLLLWLWFVYLFTHYARDPEYESFLGALNLGIHEFGHLLGMPFGEFVGVAGGSLVQCLVPLLSVVMFYRQADYFAFSFSFVWLGSNLFGVARYMADARALKLPLVTPFGGGGETIHDWNYLLHEMGLLSYDTRIAAGVRVTAILLMLAGIVWGAWVLKEIMTSRKKEIGADWDIPDVKT